ncbi:response regulator [Streptomyces sp. NPDC005506]|uniref:response regulator n=1 Tax=unclassified Streptomyces TaxID=2593676 RepID=UPI0036C78DDC
MAHIVIVEDDASIGTKLAASLHNVGHDTDWCQDGAAALARAADGGVDLLLLDLGLPDVDGFELCQRLRDRLPGAVLVVLVVLTARTGESDVIQALESGADDYLTKPFRLAASMCSSATPSSSRTAWRRPSSSANAFEPSPGPCSTRPPVLSAC